MYYLKSFLHLLSIVTFLVFFNIAQSVPPMDLMTAGPEGGGGVNPTYDQARHETTIARIQYLNEHEKGEIETLKYITKDMMAFAPYERNSNLLRVFSNDEEKGQVIEERDGAERTLAFSIPSALDSYLTTEDKQIIAKMDVNARVRYYKKLISENQRTDSSGNKIADVIINNTSVANILDETYQTYLHSYYLVQANEMLNNSADKHSNITDPYKKMRLLFFEWVRELELKHIKPREKRCRDVDRYLDWLRNNKTDQALNQAGSWYNQFYPQVWKDLAQTAITPTSQVVQQELVKNIVSNTLGDIYNSLILDPDTSSEYIALIERKISELREQHLGSAGTQISDSQLRQFSLVLRREILTPSQVTTSDGTTMPGMSSFLETQLTKIINKMREAGKLPPFLVHKQLMEMIAKYGDVNDLKNYSAQREETINKLLEEMGERLGEQETSWNKSLRDPALSCLGGLYQENKKWERVCEDWDSLYDPTQQNYAVESKPTLAELMRSKPLPELRDNELPNQLLVNEALCDYYDLLERLKNDMKQGRLSEYEIGHGPDEYIETLLNNPHLPDDKKLKLRNLQEIIYRADSRRLSSWNAMEASKTCSKFKHSQKMMEEAVMAKHFSYFDYHEQCDNVRPGLNEDAISTVLETLESVGENQAFDEGNRQEKIDKVIDCLKDEAIAEAPKMMCSTQAMYLGVPHPELNQEPRCENLEELTQNIDSDSPAYSDVEQFHTHLMSTKIEPNDVTKVFNSFADNITNLKKLHNQYWELVGKKERNNITQQEFDYQKMRLKIKYQMLLTQMENHPAARWCPALGAGRTPGGNPGEFAKLKKRMNWIFKIKPHDNDIPRYQSGVYTESSRGGSAWERRMLYPDERLVRDPETNRRSLVRKSPKDYLEQYLGKIKSQVRHLKSQYHKHVNSMKSMSAKALLNNENRKRFLHTLLKFKPHLFANCTTRKGGGGLLELVCKYIEGYDPLASTKQSKFEKLMSNPFFRTGLSAAAFGLWFVPGGQILAPVASVGLAAMSLHASNLKAERAERMRQAGEFDRSASDYVPEVGQQGQALQRNSMRLSEQVATERFWGTIEMVTAAAYGGTSMARFIAGFRASKTSVAQFLKEAVKPGMNKSDVRYYGAVLKSILQGKGITIPMSESAETLMKLRTFLTINPSAACHTVRYGQIGLTISSSYAAGIRGTYTYFNTPSQIDPISEIQQQISNNNLMWQGAIKRNQDCYGFNFYY